jgi:hypothetical protein
MRRFGWWVFNALVVLSALLFAVIPMPLLGAPSPNRNFIFGNRELIVVCDHVSLWLFWFDWHQKSLRTPGAVTQLHIYLWVPLVLCVGIIAARLIVWNRQRRKPAGSCQHCGYDLTGNVSGICPECGKAVAD